MVRTKDNIAKLTLEFIAITDQADIPGDRPFFILIHEHIIHGYKIILDSSDHEFLDMIAKDVVLLYRKS